MNHINNSTSKKHKLITSEILKDEIGIQYLQNNWQYECPRHVANYQPKSTEKVNNRPTSCLLEAGYSDRIHPWGIRFDRNQQTTLNSQPKVIVEELARIHLENIRSNLERRLQAAKASGNETLINLLEDECQQLELRSTTRL